MKRQFDVYRINPAYRKPDGPVLIASSILGRPFPGTHAVGSSPMADFLGTFPGIDEAEAIRGAMGLDEVAVQ